ncbi:MAG: FtsK/SpoIIIE domain-containing protein [Magnetococcus sp. YQC-9]
MMIQCGQRLQLSQLIDPNLPFVIGLRFNPPGNDHDCVCLGTDAHGQVQDDRYTIFFNQPISPCRGVALATPEDGHDGFEFNLPKIPEPIFALVIAATLDPLVDFSIFTSIDISIIQKGSANDLISLKSDQFAHGERAVILVQIYRKEQSWRLHALGQGFAGGLQSLIQHYGIQIHSSETNTPPPSPPLSLLPPDDLADPDNDPNQINMLTDSIARTLSEFGVRGNLVGVDVGPILMTFKFAPAPGVKVKKVTDMEPELTLALSCPGLRIDPLFHHGVIGIEIPKQKRAIIPLRRILEARMLKEEREPLLIPVGVDTRGEPILENLEHLPHLMIAGTTRSGKSIMLHGILCSVLLRARLDEARILLVDPKRNEFSQYNEVPHLLGPIVTSARQARNSLHWLTEEMESRYQAMIPLGVRNLGSWKEKFNYQALNPDLETIPTPPPLLLVVVDELADLMLQSGKSVEEPLVRLAQMGRAAGIHLVLATQRPSREVMTGLIKSNIPARLAFKVTSKVDSRIILDIIGAENLLGQGDGLFVAPGQELCRIQAPMVTESQVLGVVRYLKNSLPYIPNSRLLEALTLEDDSQIHTNARPKGQPL